MRTTTRIALAAACGLAARAAAQSYTTDSIVSVPMTWREATSSGGTVPNPDGILEPGEFALIWLDVSFTNQGGLATFWPPIGDSSHPGTVYAMGTIRGFGSGFFDIVGSGGTVGAFNQSAPLANSTGTYGFGVRGAWRLAGNGTVNPASTGLINMQFGQFPANPEGVNFDNPIPRMLRFTWRPNDFTPRTARFDVDPAVVAGGMAASVYLDFGGNVGASVYAWAPTNLNLGSVSIPIVPAPPTLTLAAAALLLRRPRRSGA